ncbi:exopolyphosphatase [Exophiala viscosa]|uniref:Exopolyphosphatase n=1 Tax=Exophiala viscosa TaxID=2486360 RepID=A0AAN6IH57_9EURO|nr:exopolyphosphatase [Exophiala viscosa]
MSQPAPPEESAPSDETMPTLSSYLSRVRSAVCRHSSSLGSPKTNRTGQKTTLVMGNPSADLDSFISAVVFSYFYNLKAQQNSARTTTPTYIPILNLPTVRSSELWRLRPEYGVALRLALGEDARTIRKQDAGEQGKTSVLGEVLTIADVLDDRRSTLHSVFAPSPPESNGDEQSKLEQGKKQDIILVDHNAPALALPGVDERTIETRLNVVGCIDHHVDEGYVSADAEPRIITTGIGSCTSLVVKHLRDQGMWPSTTASETTGEDDGGEGIRQIARLALAPVLIDTSNLRASGDKCSDVDREVVKFLEGIVASSKTTGDTPVATTGAASTENGNEARWNRDAFHQVIGSAKANSLDLLSMQEVFDRDYKVWTEAGKQGQVNVGISSLVKPLSWLIGHAGSIEKFLDEVDRFADERKLGVFSMLTRAAEGKEVVVLVDESVDGVIEKFEDKGELEDLVDGRYE